MPHWSSSPEAGQELEVEYDNALQEYRQLVLKGSPAEQYNYKKSVLTPLATDLRRAREHWRNVGESVAAAAVADNKPVPEGGRAFVKVENDRDGFDAPGDPERGEAVHTVTQDPGTGKKSLVVAQGGKKPRATKASNEDPEAN